MTKIFKDLLKEDRTEIKIILSGLKVVKHEKKKKNNTQGL